MLGCIAYVLVFGKHPFEHKNIDKIINCEVSYPAKSSGFLPTLVQDLLVKDPHRRLTAKSLVARLVKKLTYNLWSFKLLYSNIYLFLL